MDVSSAPFETDHVDETTGVKSSNISQDLDALLSLDETAAHHVNEDARGALELSPSAAPTMVISSPSGNEETLALSPSLMTDPSSPKAKPTRESSNVWSPTTLLNTLLETSDSAMNDSSKLGNSQSMGQLLADSSILPPLVTSLDLDDLLETTTHAETGTDHGLVSVNETLSDTDNNASRAPVELVPLMRSDGDTLVLSTALATSCSNTVEAELPPRMPRDGFSDANDIASPEASRDSATLESATMPEAIEPLEEESLSSSRQGSNVVKLEPLPATAPPQQVIDVSEASGAPQSGSAEQSHPEHSETVPTLEHVKAENVNEAPSPECLESAGLVIDPSPTPLDKSHNLSVETCASSDLPHIRPADSSGETAPTLEESNDKVIALQPELSDGMHVKVDTVNEPSSPERLERAGRVPDSSPNPSDVTLHNLVADPFALDGLPHSVLAESSGSVPIPEETNGTASALESELSDGLHVKADSVNEAPSPECLENAGLVIDPSPTPLDKSHNLSVDPCASSDLPHIRPVESSGETAPTLEESDDKVIALQPELSDGMHGKVDHVNEPSSPERLERAGRVPDSSPSPSDVTLHSLVADPFALDGLLHSVLAESSGSVPIPEETNGTASALESELSDGLPVEADSVNEAPSPECLESAGLVIDPFSTPTDNIIVMEPELSDGLHVEAEMVNETSFPERLEGAGLVPDPSPTPSDVTSHNFVVDPFALDAHETPSPKLSNALSQGVFPYPSNETSRAELLPDVLSQGFCSGPSNEATSSSNKLDESLMFSSPNKSVLDSSPNKSVLDSSFFDASSIPDQSSVSSPTNDHWPLAAMSASGSDVASSDDEGLLSFITAVEQHDEMTQTSKETISTTAGSHLETATANQVETTTPSLFVEAADVSIPPLSTSAAVVDGAASPTTPKRSGRELQAWLDGSDAGTKSSLIEELKTPNIESLPPPRMDVATSIAEPKEAILSGETEGVLELDETQQRSSLHPDSIAESEPPSHPDARVELEPSVTSELPVLLESALSQTAMDSNDDDVPRDHEATSHTATDQETQETRVGESTPTSRTKNEATASQVAVGELRTALSVPPIAGNHCDNVDVSQQADDPSKPAPPPIDDDPSFYEGTVAVSPLSSKNHVEPSVLRENARLKGKLKTLQVEFPSALDTETRLKRSDVSLSSASSTISHGSFTKGRVGTVATLNADEMQQRRNSSGDSLPPRFPEKGKELNENPSAFVDTLSKKLNTGEENSYEDTERVETKWIKQSQPTSFNPLKSIFAGKSDASKGSEISPPGSPPEPYYSFSDDWDSSHGGDSCGMSSQLPFNFEAGTWDMMLPTENPPLLDASLHGTLELGIYNGAESFITPSETDTAASLRLTGAQRYGKTTSVFKRRGFRDFSSLQSESGIEASSQGTFRQRQRVIPTAKSDGHASLSVSEHASRPALSSLRCHQSSPDLRKHDELQIDVDDGTPSAVMVSSLPHDSTKYISEAPSSVKLTPEALVDRFAKLNDGGSVEPEHRGALLEEELLAFSSIRRIDLPFRVRNPSEALTYVGSTRWRQVVSCWKHSEMTRALMTRPIAPATFASANVRAKTDSYSRGSSRHGDQTLIDDIKLNGASLNDLLDFSGAGYCRLQDQTFTLPSITRFLADVGGWPLATSCPMKHDVASSSINDLLDAARLHLSPFTALIQEIVNFASFNSPGEPTQENSSTFSVGFKAEQAIERKANLKYNGNHSLVKDILRGQVTFANEGELVCGLIYVLRSSGIPDNEVETSPSAQFEIARVKNLFSDESTLSCLSVSPLPTGYRHVLLNLRMKDGFLVEIQFNLLSMFSVLASEGYTLHRELLELDNALGGPDKSSNQQDISRLLTEVATDSLSMSFEKLLGGLSPDNCSNHADGSDEGRTTPTKATSPSQLDSETPQTKNKQKINSDSTAISQISVNEDSCAGVGNGRASTAANDSVPSPKRLRSLVVSDEARRKLLNDISGTTISSDDVVLAILEHGSNAASENPRDSSTFICLHIIFSWMAKHESSISLLGCGIRHASDVIRYSQQCLLRSLTISNQAISAGMAGWLEYGRSSALDRLSDRPFVVLRQLAYNYGRLNLWDEAESILLSLVVRCEQYLAQFHPTTLTSLLDLAIAARELGKTAFSERLVERVASRLSCYLGEVEAMHMSHLSTCVPSGNKSGEKIFRVEHGREACSLLREFVSLFRIQLGRDMAALVGSNDEIMLINHCFVADSLLVLENCETAARSVLGSGEEGMEHVRLAFAHYQLAFNGFSTNKGLDDSSAIKAAYGLARCLRELGETKKALQLLTLVVSFTEAGEPKTKDGDVSESNEEIKEESAGDVSDTCQEEASTRRTIEFLPFAFSAKVASEDQQKVSKHTSSALCLWLMAILSLDQSSSEDGREEAFSYLHAASVSLQSALTRVSRVDDEATKTMCIRFLSMIEDEAMKISEQSYE